MADAGSSQAPISFGFSRSSKKKLLVGDGEKKEGGEKEYVLGAEGKELLSANPTPESKPLVIPLIDKNRWAKPNKTKDKEEDASPRTEEEAVLSQAVKELIEESRRAQEDTETNQTLSIPLLMQNRIPDGYEDGEKVDVSLRPDSAEAADYDVVPVEHYGMAMLRGMGWKEGEGIGHTFKQDVKPLEQKLRPKGLGLGADRSALKDLDPKKPRKPLKPGEEPQEESKGLGTGSAVQIQSGAHKDMYGKVEGTDPDNSRAMIKLAIGGKVVTVSLFSLRLASSAEYTKYAKDLSRLSKAHQESKVEPHRDRTPEKEQRTKDGEKGKDSQVGMMMNDVEKRNESSRNGDSNNKEKRHRQRSPDQEKLKKKIRPEPHGWLRRDLRVRFIDKNYKGGKHYNSKMLVEDVLSPTRCVCRTESGRILEGWEDSSQRQAEK
ncbi:G-patch domain and KOW motifs-containing protein-like isoform X2 [Xenopus laevis]|uniref:G-patch domain and KOW motifs-containing protein n=1 Tax=Xenopus laevis TaxID=8355 RepID=A0A8J1LKI5_XENLA|nr:G-patch domain and KOW motifs-containing protein-like isoform X2 [Xenopus laevis]